MVTVGERIRKRRRELGLSQRDIASEGVSFPYISRIENGKRKPSMKALRLLAARLGVSTHWLETGEQDPAEQLARLVLAHPAGLPPQAQVLARRVLENGHPQVPPASVRESASARDASRHMLIDS